MILFPATPDTRRESTNKTNNSGFSAYSQKYHIPQLW